MQRAQQSRTQRNRRRFAFVIVATIAAFGSLIAHPSDPASATTNDEAQFLAALNQIRADNGLPAFTVNNELSNLARGHAQVMADAGEIFHASPISAGFSGPWSKLGENVGVGANVAVLVDAFVASSGHFANIIDPSFTQIGVGVIWKDSALYTTHRFLQPPGATPPPTTAPTPVTTAEVPVTTAPLPPPPPTTAPAPVAPTTTTTTTTLAPLQPPAITAERVVALLDMLDLVGT